jgi:hypothetical protein
VSVDNNLLLVDATTGARVHEEEQLYLRVKFDGSLIGTVAADPLEGIVFVCFENVFFFCFSSQAT